MPEQYQQGQLASPAVGTPGVDQSAGQAEQQIAQSLDRMSQSTAAEAMQQLGQAEQNFNQARGMFFYQAQQLDAGRRRQEALEEQQAEKQRQWQVRLDKIDEEDRLSGVVEGLKKRYTADPDSAVSEFKNQLPLLQQNFRERYSDLKRLQMLTEPQRLAERAALSNLQSWARTATNQNLSQRLSLLPEQLGTKIDGLSGPVDEQLRKFDKHLFDINGIYDGLRGESLTQGDHDEILVKQIQMNKNAGKQFVDHLMAQTPDGEQGVGYLNMLRDIVSKAKDLRLPIDSNDQKQAIEHLAELRKSREQQVITDIQTDGLIKIADAKILRLSLDDAQNDPETMAKLDSQLKDRARNVRDQIERIGKTEPDERLRKAKIGELKKELTELLGGAEKETALQRSWLSEIRAREGQSRAIQGFAMSLTRFQQAQEDRMLREEHGKIVQEFNDKWSKFLNNTQGVLSAPAGQKQQEAMTGIAREALSIINEARERGAITANQYGTLLEQIKGKINVVSGSKTVQEKFLGFIETGQVKTVPLTKAEKAKKEVELRQQFGKMVVEEASRISAVKASARDLDVLTTSPGEKALLSSYIYTHMPKLLDSAAYKQLSPEKKTALNAKYVREVVQRFRKGTLR